MTKLLALLCVLSASSISIAAPSGVPVVNIYTGATPFMIVNKGTAKKPPGLYRSGARGELIVPGPLLADTNGDAFIRQLSLAKIDGRAYALVVADGQIRLVTNASDHNDPETVLTFGSPETPLVEVGSGQRRALPKVSSVSGISVYASDSLVGNNQAVLVSIKFDEATVFGTGMTFAFALRPLETGSNKISLHGKPVVLDSKFHSMQALSTLISETGTGTKLVYSQNLVDQVENAIPETDPGVIEKMGEHWNAFMAWFDQQIAFLRQTPARTKVKLAYDLGARRTVRDIEFARTFERGMFHQKFNPTQQTGQVEVTLPGRNAFVQDGFIDINGLTAVSAYNDGEAIYSIDGKLHFAFINSKGKTLSIELPLDLKSKARQLSFKTLVNGAGDLKKHALIFSVELDDGTGFTGLASVTEHSPTVASVSAATQVLDRYLSTDLLEARLHQTENSHWMFDNATPYAETVEAYKFSQDQQSARLNVTMSAGEKPIYQYTSSLKTVNFDKGLNLAFFQEMPHIPNASGLYATLESPSGLQANSIRGQILTRGEDENLLELPREKFPLSRLSYQVSAGDGSVFAKEDRSVYVFAIDPTFKNGENGFVVAVASNVMSDKPEQYSLRYIKHMSPELYRYDQLYSVKAVRGRGPSKEVLFVFLSFATGPKQGATTMIPVSLANDKGSLDEPRKLKETIRITDQVLTESDIEKRTLYSEEGLPYFVRTPQHDITSPSFEVFDLLNAETLKPALRTGKKALKFVDNAEKHFADGNEDSWSDRIDAKMRWQDWSESFTQAVRSASGGVEELSQFESFRDLKEELDRMVLPGSTPKQKILVVPSQLRDLVWGYVGALYNTRKSDHHAFSAGNDRLELSVFDKIKAYQDYFFANMESMANAPRRKRHAAQSFLLARMDDLQASDRPKSSKGENFVIRELQSSDVESTNGISTQTDLKPPNALYLLAAGGAVPIEEFRKSPPTPNFSSLIIATPEELKKLESDASLEVDSGLLKAFDIGEIKNPDAESMTASLLKIFANSDIQSLGYSFNAGEIRRNVQMSPEQHANTVVEYAISRFQSLVSKKDLSVFESFMRFRSAFGNAVLTDREVRRSRVINKFFVERVLTQVFDIPINLNTLPEDDPLKILARKDAALRLLEAGYGGPFELKRKLLKTILSQTQADSGKKIPSSTLLFGESGSGKTFWFDSLRELLGLKMYNFANGADNRAANAIVVNVGKLTPGNADNGTAEGMGVEAALRHLNNFIQLPHGYRGYILIDDGHANIDEVKGKIIAWTRGIFEATDGLLRIGSTTRSVRNLNLYMTANPVSEQKQIEDFAKNKAAPTPEEILLATLSTKTFKVESSYLNRWGLIINVDSMPAGAKGPGLIKALGEASREQLTTSGRVGLVDPKVVEQIVRQSEKLDARNFLASSVSAILQAINEAHLNGSIGMVIANNPRYVPPVNDMSAIPANGITPAERLSEWVAKNTRVISLDGSLEGRLAHLRLIVDAYRTPVYEFLANAVSEDPRFSSDPLSEKRLLAPVLMAIRDHVQERGAVPVNAIPLLAKDFDMNTSSERANFRETIERLSEHEKPFFPIQISAPGLQSTWDDVIGKTSDVQETGRGRRDVLFDTMVQLRSVMKDHLNVVMQVPDFEATDDPTRWLKSLDAKENPAIRQVGKKLVESIWHYLPAMFDEGLIESRTGLSTINTYVAARMFMYAVDRAIVDLPWVKVNRFLLTSLDLVAQDQVLSQKPGIQAFLFSNRHRLVKPTTPDLINQIIVDSSAYKDTPAKTRQRLAEEFSSDCEKYLIPTKN